MGTTWPRICSWWHGLETLHWGMPWFCCCVACHAILHFSVDVLTNYSAYFHPNLGFHTWIVSWNSYWDGVTSHTTLWRKSWGSSTQCFGTASSAAKPRSTGSHTATASIPLIIYSVTMPWFTCADESRRPLMNWRKPSKTLRERLWSRWSATRWVISAKDAKSVNKLKATTLSLF